MTHQRTRTDIVKSLLRKAKNGNSSYSLDEMRGMIRDVFQRAREKPDEHILALCTLITEPQSDSRYLRAVNLIAKKEGRPERLIETHQKLQS